MVARLVPRASRPLSVLLVKPHPRLRQIAALHRFQFLEPIELGYLAAAVPPPHRVAVVDLRLSRFPDGAFRRALRVHAPDVVGITGYTHEAAAVKALARTVRACLPETVVVVGGHHATVAPHDYDRPEFDAIVRGEGCGPFRAVVEAVAAGDRVDEVAGILRPGHLDDATTAGFPAFPDPATLPSPRRDLWDPRRYTCVWAAESSPRFSRLFPPTSMVRTSFGCSMRCSFCIVPKLFDGHHLPRPEEAVADEIAALPTDHVYFCDDENFIDPEFAHALAGALERRGVRKRYFAWTRATTVNRYPDLFARWRALGLDAAFLGFEYSSDEELRAAKKGSTLAQNEKAHTALRAAGIAVHAAFMVHPEFGRDDFERLRRYVAAMPPAQFSFTVCTPSPGTDDYARIERDIWVDDPHALHDCMHPLTPTRLPLREFSALFGRQVRDALAKNPRREARNPLHPADILRVATAQSAYGRAFDGLYRDYPRALWNVAAG